MEKSNLSKNIQAILSDTMRRISIDKLTDEIETRFEKMNQRNVDINYTFKMTKLKESYRLYAINKFHGVIRNLIIDENKNMETIINYYIKDEKMLIEKNLYDLLFEQLEKYNQEIIIDDYSTIEMVKKVIEQLELDGSKVIKLEKLS